MENSRQTLLNLLKCELEFVKAGGYRRSAHSPWRAPYIFEESPNCPNFFDRTRQHLCHDCWLMRFVPLDYRDEQIPCRFVQLGNGITVDSLYRCGTPAETEEMLLEWLRVRIHELETELQFAPKNEIEGQLESDVRSLRRQTR
jgi:hypothetical protein